MTRLRFDQSWLRYPAGIAAGGLLIGFAWLYYATAPQAIPRFESIRDQYRSSEAALLDRHGELLQTLRMDYGARRLEWTALADISPAATQAIVQAEDHRFRRHGGVDALSLIGAARDRVLRGSRRGASTLEMQVAAQIDSMLAKPGRRGWLQKLQQLRAARSLARAWSKDQVLEAYLNLASFRGETGGIAAASYSLFGKAPRGLTTDEAWTLAALLPSPGAAPESVAWRACRLAKLRDESCDAQRRETVTALSNASPIANRADDAAHLARRLLRQPGEQVTASLDARTQRLALHALRAQLMALNRESVRDGAAVVIDNASGEVLAYIGSAGPSSHAAQVDGARALRQAGSTLKPFLYSLAMERGWITAASLLDDSPLALEAGPGLYLPQNYEHDFKGLVSARTALAGSLNIPAVRTLLITGVEPFRERLHALGYVDGLTESGEFYGYSLALGSAEVSLLEQVNAYRTLANGGQWSPLKLRPDDQPGETRSVVTPQAAFIVSDILSDRGARAVTFDLQGPLSTPYWSAVKTGTSKDLRDNWCIGYTQRYTVGVWVGNFEGDAMRTVSGITGAAPAWREIMDGLQNDNRDGPRPTPQGLKRQQVRFNAGSETARQEWFITGTETQEVGPALRIAARARLVSPAAGSLVALDPDIPLDRQHVVLRAEPSNTALRLTLDEHDIGNAAQPQLWTPLPGEHRLRLLDAAGQTLDEIGFSVRTPR